MARATSLATGPSSTRSMNLPTRMAGTWPIRRAWPTAARGISILVGMLAPMPTIRLASQARPELVATRPALSSASAAAVHGARATATLPLSSNCSLPWRASSHSTHHESTQWVSPMAPWCVRLSRRNARPLPCCVQDPANRFGIESRPTVCPPPGDMPHWHVRCYRTHLRVTPSRLRDRSPVRAHQPCDGGAGHFDSTDARPSRRHHPVARR